MINLNVSQIDRVSANIQLLLNSLITDIRTLEKNSLNLRTKIKADLVSLTKGMPNEERQKLLKRITGIAQANLHAAGSTARISPSGGCVGRDGGGIVIEDGSFSGKICVTGSLSDGITGGGVEGGWSY